MQILQFLPTGVLRLCPFYVTLELQLSPSEMCNPVQARLLPGADGCSHLLFLSLIFNSNNVMGIIMRPMKERNILTPRIYTPSTASISFLSLFLFLNLAIARHISFSFPCLPHQAYHRSQYFLAPSPASSFCKAFIQALQAKSSYSVFLPPTLLTYYFLQTCFETIKCNS